MEVPKTFRKDVFADILSNMIYFQNLKFSRALKSHRTAGLSRFSCKNWE